MGCRDKSMLRIVSVNPRNSNEEDERVVGSSSLVLSHTARTQLVQASPKQWRLPNKHVYDQRTSISLPVVAVLSAHPRITTSVFRHRKDKIR